MQQELERLRGSEKALRGKLRDIELDNDDLEKSERAISSTLSDVESRYNRAIERTALLEQELVDKARLEEELQRTKDELRDNVEELAVMCSARDEALANASTAGARVRELELQVSQQRTNYPSSSALQAFNTPERINVPGDATKRASAMPSPDIDSADEGSTMSRAVLPGSLASLPSSKAQVLEVPSTRNSLTRGIGMTRSDTIQNLSAVSLRNSYSPATTREKKSEGIINDMRGLTLRMQSMSQSLNTRRDLMAGSAIPRPSPRKQSAPVREKEPVTFPRSSSSHSMTESRRGTYAKPSTGTQRPIECFGTGARQSESFKSLAIGRPASRLGDAGRGNPSMDSNRSVLRSSRPASRLSYGSAIPRPETPSQSISSATAMRVIRRVSMGPNSTKRMSRQPEHDSVPPLPVTPTNFGVDQVTKRNSLANSIRKPSITSSSQPAWR